MAEVFICQSDGVMGGYMPLDLLGGVVGTGFFDVHVVFFRLFSFSFVS